jgi:arylsulfatase A-like enzyme
LAVHLTRRELLEGTLALAAGAKLMGASGCGGDIAIREGASQERPSVLFIAIDDLNDWIAALGGYPRVFTPNFDRLIARGVLFTRAYATATECNPSRVSVMTGLRPSTTGIYRNIQPFRRQLPDVITLNQYFQSHRYHVAGCGKIYHGEKTRFGDPKHWDVYFSSPKDPVPAVRPLSGISHPFKGFDWGPIDASDQEMSDMQLTNWVVGYLQAEHQKPFFLACGFERPHMPLYVPKKYFDMYPLDQVVLPEVKPDDLEDVPEVARRRAVGQGDHELITSSENWKPAIQAYLASISFTDACIGRILDAVDESPRRNLVIVLWSDHGFHLGEKLHWQKFTLWEESTRVPLVFVAPGVTKSKQICGRTVELLDVYPTLLDLCGLPAAGTLEGRSLVPLLKDPQAPWTAPAISTFGRNNHAIRTERWRYIRYADGTEELYDHAKDPNEWTNLAALDEFTEVKRELSAWLPRVNAKEAPSDKKKKPRQMKKSSR